MRISENEICKMIKESIEKVLSEGISEITYHFCSFPSCINILGKNKFYLTMSSNKADAFDNKRLFYLSTQRGRNKDIGYAGHLGSCVRIQLDGRALSTVCTGKPVDYWGASMGKQTYYNKDFDQAYGMGFSRGKRTHHNFEMEDRILSYSPVIEDASKYITRIDVYIDPQTERLERLKDRKESVDEINKKISDQKIYAATIYSLCGSRKIPFYCYLSLKDFNFMTNNTINAEIADLYNNYYKLEHVGGYFDSDLYKVYDEERHRNTKVTILCELFNILTRGAIARHRDKQEYYKLIIDTLNKYGLGEYKNDVIKKIRNWGWGHSALDSCIDLGSSSNVPIRKLNHEIGGDDSIKIMKFGADVLKKFGVNNFETLARKIEIN